MKKINDLSRNEIGKLFPIKLEEHNQNWANLFVEEATLLFETLGTSIFRLHHIGSTSVPGLLSKPTIDILVEVGRNTDVESIIDAMKEIGYEHNQKRDLDTANVMFMKGYSIDGIKGQTYHVHVRYPGDWDELYFCDYLSKYPSVCHSYAQIKLKLKEMYEFDREAYTDGKTEFVKSIVKLARDEFYPRYVILKNPQSR